MTRATTTSMPFSLPNPIPSEMTDPKEQAELWAKYRLIPYYGDNLQMSHGYLDLLQTLTQMSETFVSVMRDRSQFTFGLNLDVVARVIPGLASEPVEIDRTLKENFALWLMEIGLPLTDIMRLSRRGELHLEQSGNTFIRIRRVTVGGTTKYFVDIPHYKHVVYIWSEDPGERFVIVSKHLGDYRRMLEHEPQLLRVTQPGDPIRWITGDDPGIETAIVHVKLNTFEDEGDYYGRPAAIGVMTWLYTDFQQGNLQSRLSASEIISKKLLAFEGEDPNALRTKAPAPGEGTVTMPGTRRGRALSDFENNMLVFKGIATNMEAGATTLGPKDGVSSIAGIKYPHGGKPPTVIDIEMNRDTRHQEMQIQRASAVICSSLGWAPELIGSRPAKANLGGNLLYDTLVMKSVSTVETRQNFWQNIWNSIIGEVCETEGKQGEFKSLGIDFPDNIDRMLERFTLSAKSSAPNDLIETQPDVDEDVEETANEDEDE